MKAWAVLNIILTFGFGTLTYLWVYYTNPFDTDVIAVNTTYGVDGNYMFLGTIYGLWITAFSIRLIWGFRKPQRFYDDILDD
jgi:hypothetical protein